MARDLQETCMFFVDDSNIWIEHQKFAASGKHKLPKLEDGDRDPRFRIDIGELVKALRRGRARGESFLYGSRPPPNDSVWKAFKRFHFNTKIYERSSAGKEKEVDNSMATDLSAQATELAVHAKYSEHARRSKEHTIFVAITGDRDMLPPIKRVLSLGIRVELWAWKSGVSTEYLKLQAIDSLPTVYPLDDIFDQISFTNFRSTLVGGRPNPGKAVVLCRFSEDVIEENIEAFVSGHLLRLARLFYLTPAQTGTDTWFVEFPNVENIGGMVGLTRDAFKDAAVVMSWPEYKSRFHRDPPPPGTTLNRYLPLASNGQVLDKGVDAGRKEDRRVEALPPIEDPDNDGWEMPPPIEDPDDNGGWETVNRTNRVQDHHRAQHHKQWCIHGIRCAKRDSCSYRHSEAERRRFAEHPDKNYRRWKTEPCRYAVCHDKRNCGYAHSEKEAWCQRCRCEGHFLSSGQYTH